MRSKLMTINHKVMLLLLIVTMNAVACHLFPNTFNYHNRIGIERARKIKEDEDNIMRCLTSRVVGGHKSSIKEAPYQAGLIIALPKKRISMCGGSLISVRNVITAAHCINDGVSDIIGVKVVLGSEYLYHGGLRVEALKAVFHPRWDASIVKHDIGIITMEPIVFTDVIQRISLPNEKENYIGEMAVVSGFGYTNDDGSQTPRSLNLNIVSVPVVSRKVCRLVYGFYVRNYNICTSGAGKKGACQGDSGGPLVTEDDVRPVLVGIVSFGADHGCSAGQPTVYTKTSEYLKWIYENIN